MPYEALQFTRVSGSGAGENKSRRQLLDSCVCVINKNLEGHESAEEALKSVDLNPLLLLGQKSCALVALYEEEENDDKKVRTVRQVAVVRGSRWLVSEMMKPEKGCSNLLDPALRDKLTTDGAVVKDA